MYRLHEHIYMFLKQKAVTSMAKTLRRRYRPAIPAVNKITTEWPQNFSLHLNSNHISMNEN